VETILELDSVSLIRGGVEIISSASTRFYEGTATVFLGPSGSGKSSLLKTAAGIMPPERGSVHYKGQDLFVMHEDENRDFRRRNGFVFQDGALWSNRSVYENLSLPLEYHYPGMKRDEIDSRIREAIARVGFRDNPQLRPAQLSGGERKMIGFIRALMTDPELIFMDTPTDNVDSMVAGRIRRIISDLKRSGRTLLICSHDKELIADIADYLLVMDSGRILTHGAYREVLTGQDEQIREIIGSVIDADSVMGDDLLKLLNPGDENPFGL
jgi:ABC-type transporter Mla maintaining outer membrane lipid asymmetry ATPase subunit MlaF